MVKRSVSAHDRNLAGRCSGKNWNSRWERQQEGWSDLAYLKSKSRVPWLRWAAGVMSVWSLFFFLQITRAAFHSLSHSRPFPHPLLAFLFSLLWSTFSSSFSLSFPTPVLLKGSSSLIFLLPTTLYVYLILFKQLKDLKHLILHTVSSVTYFGGSSSPPFP